MIIGNIIHELHALKITGVSDDSRYIGENEAFICRKGKNYDGEDFAIEAVLNGAKAVIAENVIKALTVPIIICNNIEGKFIELLTAFYDSPWKNINMIGITGTDGKTTTASIIEYIIGKYHPCGYIGTNGIRYGGFSTKYPYTTPPFSLLIKTLNHMQRNNINYCVMEASSQGLVGGRLEGVTFDVGIFTNLTHEHLDTHGNMENYLKAKLQLFAQLKPGGLAIVNADSPYACRFFHPRISTYGIDGICDFLAFNIKEHAAYTTFSLKTKTKIFKEIVLNMTGKYNIYNALAAIICALEYKVPTPTIINALKHLPKIPGRMELLTKNENFKVYVDFAHTPNALREVLTYLRSNNTHLTAVLGSAGGKDKSKRPEMGRIACALADYVIFTSEDPRNENPEAIIEEMIHECPYRNYEIIPDRKSAIKTAVDGAAAGDTVIITGKGNDEYFEQNNRIYSYSDIIEAQSAIREKHKK